MLSAQGEPHGVLAFAVAAGIVRSQMTASLPAHDPVDATRGAGRKGLGDPGTGPQRDPPAAVMSLHASAVSGGAGLAHSRTMGAFRRHRQWAILISAAVCLLIAAGAISLTVVENVSKGPAFETAATFVRTDRVARQQLGVVLGFGIAVNGSVAEPAAGQGRANLSFDIHGSWRDGHARISAVKESGVWRVEGGVLSVNGKQFRLQCNPTSSITRCLLS
jgi:hypothetical protein